MSHDAGTPTPPAFDGVVLHQRLSDALPVLAGRVLDRLVDHVPVYDTMPGEQLRGEIQRVVEQGIGSFAAMLRTGRPPDESQLLALRQSAAKRAEEGVPVEAVVRAYHVGAQECLQQMLVHATEDDLEHVQAATVLVLQFLERMTVTVVAGFFAERQAVLGEEQSARQALLTALVEGADVAGTAARWGLDLPPCYLVLDLAIGAHPDEALDGVSPVIAAKRKLRRLRVELDRHVDGTVLSALSGDGGLALIPCRTDPDHVTGQDWTRLAGAVAHMRKVAGVDITAGAASAVAEDVPAAVALAQEVRRVAAASERPPGLYRLSDVLLEYQLMRPGPARDELAGLVRPLTARPELLDTVRAYLRCGLSRRRTAQELCVHPNTVDYRLRRAAEITGLDVTAGPDALRVRAAVSALDAAGGP
ncbi:helix-turn-helix domain-containing protein [Streptomyces kunmingensis]|uniref:Helix-turn-helix domain-containing protein n=1 Tax=Streptomyces kunmingensis TaxID=68225 RepID=A0ABU6C7L7_9ACTN|nr:helix-turn-helix domain-containing protein [Streptomyces kunmingensis]MEB3960598.1 helix-turn-helix domain-containing protein [Streptomyces kunmingensis]